MNNRIKLIIGIGNFGSKYYYTRHSIGIWFISLFVKKFKGKLIFNKEYNGYIYKLYIKNKLIILYIPNCFINICGIYIKNIANILNIKYNEIIIAYDEFDIITGMVKFKFNGNNSGHKGINDIEKKFNSSKFFKLKIGIGLPKIKKDISDFVLSKPNVIDKNLIINSIEKSIFYIYNFIDDTNKIIQFINCKSNYKNINYNIY